MSEHNTKNILNSDHNSNESINTVIMDDIESQLNTEILKKNEEKPLKSILKKESTYNTEYETLMAHRAAIFCVILLTLIFSVPLIICDLYFAYSNNSCLEIYPKNLNINMKLYLQVSAYCSIFGILFIIITVCSFKPGEENLCGMITLNLFSYISKAFGLIWHILGAVIYWGTLYPNNECSRNISTYLFISLVIKLFVQLISLFQKRENNN